MTTIAAMASRRLRTELLQRWTTKAWKETGPAVGRRTFNSSIPRPARQPSRPDPRAKQTPRVALASVFTAGLLASILVDSRPQTAKPKQRVAEPAAESTSTEIKSCYFRLSEVRLHDGSSDRPWVTKGNSVYDITDWVGAHPGGEVILRAAGGSIDPYWNIFTIHKKQYVYDILEEYKIGEIDPLDLVNGEVPGAAIEDPFTTDPIRDPSMRVLTEKPCNAESPSSALAEFLTPNSTFYIRNHMWVPVVEEQDHQLTIELSNGEEKIYSMKELKSRFKTHKVTATLQCAGNRRKDMTDHAKPTNGLQWTVGAISSAEWEGIKLRDVLLDAGVNLDVVDDSSTEDKHVQFYGLEAYGASIPIQKVIDPYGDVLLAFGMNGQQLPRDHGFPLRVIVPGNVAARSVKWLRKITISDEESPSQWQQRDYKSFGPNETNPDWTKAKSIQEMPITSAISSISIPSSSTTQDKKAPRAEGYAYSGGGREIVRVDISTDNGKTWDQAELLDDQSQTKGSKSWCWKRWRYEGPKLNQTSDDRKITVIVKATDEAYNTQPESYEHIYNSRGNLATAWHRLDHQPKE